MIVTVTLNPCNDKTVEIPAFVYGGMNRIQRITHSYSGKGFNVSRGAATLGQSSLATGFLFNDNGRATQQLLLDAGVEVDCVWCEGAIRVNTKILDLEKQVITELNESGVPATEQNTNALLDKIEHHAKNAGLLVLSGSIPPDIGEDIYARIIKRCKGLCKILLDAEGKKLLLGMEQKPEIIKPNLFELETAIGKKLPTDNDIAGACRELIDKGIETVVVSLGGDGAIAADRDGVYRAAPVKDLKLKSTVGAGDSMVAGFSSALMLKLPLEQAFRWGVAAASLCCENEGTELGTRAGFDSMLSRVEITRL